MISIFIFRRDLRFHDNTAFIEALKQAKKNNFFLMPIFIFDDRQINNNEFFSKNAFSFMINSLEHLNLELKKDNLKLYFFKGIAHEVIEKIILDFRKKNKKIFSVYVNKDYTPFSLKRDFLIKNICDKYNVNFFSYSDALLNEPGTLKTYTIFTPFWKAHSQIPVKKPEKIEIKDYEKSFYNEKIDFEKTLTEIKKEFEDKILEIKSSFSYDITNLEEIKKNLLNLTNYEFSRDYPIKNTSFLSAHLKFGTISIREAFYFINEKLGSFHPLLRQLYWRDFFYHIAYNFPDVFGNPFNKKYKNVKWLLDEKKFNAWKSGLTGFPIVDAGMRQLNQTGYMHNRVRMIVASFLTKDLHINWLLGEKYFAQKLIDYDPCLNNGNWQWSSSVGCDAQPYFRIFNPWLQQKKFDPDCLYIKKWLPELNDLKSAEIHNLEFIDLSFKGINYPKPIVNHSTESKKAIDYFKNIK
ncbi:MAG: deoxyribodipyrimidine photo-lyase [Candidatus Woesearchaeota archaeon]